MQSAEIELKFPVDDVEQLQCLLPGLGFQLDTPRTFEQNTLFDTPARTLRQTKQILRLRRYGDLWTLTHKRQPGPSAQRGPGADNESGTYTPAANTYKVRIETETHVDDGPALAAIFQQLGYAPVFRYEKFRTEWSHPTSMTESPLFAQLPIDDAPQTGPVEVRGHLVVDETPIGVYAELEGPTAWIDETLALLGIDPAICITESYGKLFLAWKERTGSAVEHLTFDDIPAAERVSPAQLAGAR